MAFNQIDTGYKPDGALGALYQGYNAADAQQMNALEMIKAALANQREQQMQPLDIQRKELDLTADQYKTTPEYQTGMRDTISGQGMSNLAAGQNAAMLQPFKQAAERGELENKTGLFRNLAKVQEIDDILNDPNVQYQGNTKQQLITQRQNLVNRFKETPDFAGKRELRETGTDSAEYIAELRAQQAREAARLKASSGDKPAKTAEEGMVRDLNTRFSSGGMTNEQYMIELANIFNAKNAAKQKPGEQGLNPQLTGNAFVPKPVQQQYAPGGTQQKPAVDLQAAILAELERRKQGK